jgi:hypothetical protein
MTPTALRIRRVLIAAVVAALAVVVSGCGTAGITRPRLEASVARTFANLYAAQRYQLGYPKLSGDTIPSKAGCDKGGPSTPDEGSGNTWVCTIVWENAGPGTQATAVYSLNVQTNGCYSADGDGPPAINGQQLITSFDGTTYVNPLWEFDGCFDTT